MRKTKIFALATALLTVSSLSIVNQAKATFGINAGVTYLSTKSSASIGVPTGGLHMVMGDSKKAIGWRNYLEFQPYKQSTVTTNYLTLTSLLAINMGKTLYLGVGPAFKYKISGTASLGIAGSVALGINLGPKFFIEPRLDLDVNPSAGTAIMDNLFFSFQLGSHFGSGRK